uniref:NADH-ubiquinone oxidoreductase chain 5 n=1 Tax=Stygobromus foliatus TaxID=1678291 RepID=A0A172QHE7_9CRUS|nr:NADH dehydrogenase subunit 5 [Stygobromus foliatus]
MNKTLLIKFSPYKIWALNLIILSAISWFSFMLVLINSTSMFIEWSINVKSGVSISASLIFDWVSLSFLGAVLMISSMILLYSEHYMKGDTNYLRFIYTMLLFVSSMCFLVISPNLISLLLGWDGLGLSSYLLVTYYQNFSSSNAGMITIMMNRVGDVGILLSLGLWFNEGSWNMTLSGSQPAELICLLLGLAAMTKSAQIPFSAWLPAAMAAPTPVSALVHSSTLVTAGVYLLVRFEPILLVNSMNSLLMISAVSTLFMAGVAANLEYDLKKIIALSTLSQLGLMMVILSMGLPELAFFHLLTHALFKSLLFMCAGEIIHMGGAAQDGRLLGASSRSSPSLMMVFVGSNAVLTGFPFLSGFYSKELMSETAFSQQSALTFSALMGLGAALTAGYSLRMVLLVSKNTSEFMFNPRKMDMSPLVVLSSGFLFFLSVCMGSILFWLIFYGSALMVLSSPQKFSVWAVMLVLIFSWSYLMSNGLNMISPVMTWFNSKMWFLGLITTKKMNKMSYYVGTASQQNMEQWMEIVGPQGLKEKFSLLSAQFSMGQHSSLISSYLMSAFIVIILLLAFI